MKRHKLYQIIVFLTVFGFFFSFVGLASAQYVPMEEIPGYGRPTDFPTYLMSLYKFGVWAVGIAALLMISFGAYMYLTSAGNTAMIGKGKTYITDAIIGIVLALTSWLILYTINPDLVRYGDLKPISGAPGTGAAGAPGTGGGPVGTTAGYKAACPDPSSKTPIDYSRAATDNKIKPDPECNKFDFSNKYGVDTKILKTIAQLESSCGRNKGPSGAHACGLMQMLPETASRYKGATVTCDQLKQSDTLAIELAAYYVSEALKGDCVTKARNKMAAVFGGYNSGIGCSGKSCSPSKHALCASGDCPGALCFECCINPGGLSESINYAWNGIGIYSKL